MGSEWQVPGAYVARLVASSEVEHILLAGIAGAYDIANNPIDQVVEVVEEKIAELPPVYALNYAITPRFGLPTAKSNSTNDINRPSRVLDIENMEGAAVAAVCQRLALG